MALMKIDRLSKREKVMLWVCGAVLLFSVGSRIALHPIRNKFTELTHSIEAAEAQLRGYHQIVVQKDQVEKEYAKFSSFVTDVPDNSKVDNMMVTEIETMVTGSDLDLLDIKAGECEKEGFFEEHIVKAEVQGSMENLTELLHQLNTSPQLLRVRRMELSPTKHGEQLRTKGSLLVTRVVSA